MEKVSKTPTEQYIRTRAFTRRLFIQILLLNDSELYIYLRNQPFNIGMLKLGLNYPFYFLFC